MRVEIRRRDLRRAEPALESRLYWQETPDLDEAGIGAFGLVRARARLVADWTSTSACRQQHGVRMSAGRCAKSCRARTPKGIAAHSEPIPAIRLGAETLAAVGSALHTTARD